MVVCVVGRQNSSLVQSNQIVVRMSTILVYMTSARLVTVLFCSKWPFRIIFSRNLSYESTLKNPRVQIPNPASIQT